MSKKAASEQQGSLVQTWRYQDDAASDGKHSRRLARFLTGLEHEEFLFDPEVLCEEHPDLDELSYAAYLLDIFNDNYFQDISGVRVRPCRVAVEMQYLDADIIGYDIDAPVKRAVYRIGSVVEGVFTLTPGWARLSSSAQRIPVPPQQDKILAKLKRAGFVTRSSVKQSGETTSFALRRLGEHIVVLTYGTAPKKRYIVRLKAALLAAGIKCRVGRSSDCKLDKSAGTPDAKVLVIGIQ
jgi:hypothetical protein